MTPDLSHLERLAARLFYNVSVQSAFAREDPNVRFIAEFQQKDGVGTKGAATLDAVEHKVYESEAEGGRAALEVNPPNSPALSRVFMWGGRAETVTEAVIEGCGRSEHFRIEELAPLTPADGAAPREGARNRFVRLVINDSLNAVHDVAVLFAWGAASDKDLTLEMMAWPIHKTAEFKT